MDSLDVGVKRTNEFNNLRASQEYQTGPLSTR